MKTEKYSRRLASVCIGEQVILLGFNMIISRVKQVKGYNAILFVGNTDTYTATGLSFSLWLYITLPYKFECDEKQTCITFKLRI